MEIWKLRDKGDNCESESMTQQLLIQVFQENGKDATCEEITAETFLDWRKDMVPMSWRITMSPKQNKVFKIHPHLGYSKIAEH